MSKERQLGGRVALPDGSLVSARLRLAQTIVAIEPDAGAGEDFIFPGFIDLQVNGADRSNVMEAAKEGILQIASTLLREGTTAFLATAITAPFDRIAAAEAAVAAAIEVQAQPTAGYEGAAILGLHLEGPFISPHRLGAHRKYNLSPEPEAIDRVMALPSLKMITMAPELDGACAAIRRLAFSGISVSIGHSDATYQQAIEGLSAGACCFTHLFNAMRPLHHREPGLIGAALCCAGARVAVIPDGVHVAPEILKLVYRLRGPHDLVLTTDRIAAVEPIRIERGAARLPDGSLTGTCISMLDGVRMMVGNIGVQPGEAALMAATNPAAILGLADRGALRVGARADLLVLDPNLELKTVLIAGHEP